MKLATVAITISSLTAASGSPIETREIGGVLICTGANATGDCVYDKYELNTCHQLEPPFLANASTFAPDGDAFACYPRLTDCGGLCTSPTGCTFGLVDFGYEHKFDLSAIQWNTLIRSFDCFEKQT